MVFSRLFSFSASSVLRSLPFFGLLFFRLPFSASSFYSPLLFTASSPWRPGSFFLTVFASRLISCLQVYLLPFYFQYLLYVSGVLSGKIGAIHFEGTGIS